MKNAATLTPITQLLAQQACRDLVIQAATLTDAQDHEGFAALFTEDGVLIRPAAQPLQGRAAIVTSYRTRPPGRITRHLISNTRVTLESDTQAQASSYVLLWNGLESDAVGPFGRPAQARQLIGEFDDRFVLTPDGWRIYRRVTSFVLFREEGA
jgi:3-phenylpropionate/cinnamic acid dioxygenase small subunit